MLAKPAIRGICNANLLLAAFIEQIQKTRLCNFVTIGGASWAAIALVRSIVYIGTPAMVTDRAFPISFNRGLA